MRKHLVSLARSPQTTPDSDGFFEDLTPATWWAEILPEGAWMSDGTRTRGYRLRGRFHSGIDVDTRVVWVDTASVSHELFVRGVTNVEGAGARLELYCEEVLA